MDAEIIVCYTSLRGEMILSDVRVRPETIASTGGISHNHNGTKILNIWED